MDAMQLELTRLAPAYWSAAGLPAAGLPVAGLPAAGLPVLCRVAAMLAVAPPFASAAVPRRVRALLAMGMTIGLLPGIPSPSGGAATPGAWIIGLGGEVLIGLAMGLALAMVFAAAGMAGDAIAAQLGLSLAEAYDPRTGGQGTVVGQVFWLIAAVVFFAANGHHAMLRAVAASFAALPPLALSGGGMQAAGASDLLIGLLQSATVLAIQIAAPVFVATLVADLALGMVARTIPQLGVMTAGVTVRAAVGLIALIAGIAGTVALLRGMMTVNGTGWAGLIAGG